MKTHNRIRVAVLLGAFASGCSGSAEPTMRSQGEALAASCVQNVLCIKGAHWDPQACKCVPDACVSSEDGPCGGFTTHPCTCAPGLVCVPNRIPDVPGTCEQPRCCPATWNMYRCNEENGGTAFACHNPLLGCASSLTCGQGCDFEVTGQCSGPSCVTAADCTGVLPQLCMVCSDGGAACAHWACVAGQCQVAYCQ
jgi:hypothetical protein